MEPQLRIQRKSQLQVAPGLPCAAGRKADGSQLANEVAGGRPGVERRSAVQVELGRLTAEIDAALGSKHLEEQKLRDLHLLVDGVRIEPCVRGFSARFTVPAAAKAVWLVSRRTIAEPTALAGSPLRGRVPCRPHHR